MDASTLVDERDVQIYNDYDFYQQLLNDFLAAHDLQADEGQDDDKYLGSADINLTKRFLQRRQQLKEAAGEQKKKEVDRKASKARKIRYVVHDKILNFMSAMQNHQLEEGRDAIVSNLFGVGTGKRPVEMVRQVKAGDVKLI